MLETPRRNPITVFGCRFLVEPTQSGNRIRHRNNASMFLCVLVGTEPYFSTWILDGSHNTRMNYHRIPKVGSDEIRD